MISRKTGFVTGISKLKRNNGNTIRISIEKKKIRLRPFFFFCAADANSAGKWGVRGGREDRSTCHRMSTHDRSRVGRGINMKSCRLIYDPGGRCLIYDATPSPPGKRRLYFLSACDAFLHGANRRSNSPFPFFFPFFQNQTCVTVSRDLYSCPTLVKVDSYSIIFTHRDDCRLTRYLEISRASRNIYCFQLVAEKKKKFNSLRKSKGMIETLRVSYIK